MGCGSSQFRTHNPNDIARFPYDKPLSSTHRIGYTDPNSPTAIVRRIGDGAHMLPIGSFRSALHGQASRRAFLTAGALAPLALSFSPTSAPRLAAAENRRKAKSVILLWLWGAPSHLDTFDPKPNAAAEFRGPFATIPTRNPGVRVTELFPKLASRSDLYTLIRSMKNFDGDHLKAGTIALTGSPETASGGALPPNFGSVVARHAGHGELPAFLALGRGNPRDVVGPMKGFGGGTWGRTYDPFPVACSDAGETDVPALKLLEGMTPGALANRRTLLADLDRLQRRTESVNPDKWDTNCRRAYALLTNPEARKALDLSQESTKIRDSYGHTSFGQSCLLARRLAEAGVPYIQVNWSQYVEAMTPNCDFGWDTHIYNFDLLPDRHAPILDRAFSALLDDLRQRGMLETTLVLAMGEFGRTPRINGQAARDHWPQCYFSMWAGAGIRPGQVIGESDSTGSAPVTDPITPAMVGATIMELTGIDIQARAELGVLPGARVIHELF